MTDNVCLRSHRPNWGMVRRSMIALLRQQLATTPWVKGASKASVAELSSCRVISSLLVPSTVDPYHGSPIDKTMVCRTGVLSRAYHLIDPFPANPECATTLK